MRTLCFAATASYRGDTLSSRSNEDDTSIDHQATASAGMRTTIIQPRLACGKGEQCCG